MIIPFPPVWKPAPIDPCCSVKKCGMVATHALRRGEGGYLSLCLIHVVVIKEKNPNVLIFDVNEMIEKGEKFEGVP